MDAIIASDTPIPVEPEAQLSHRSIPILRAVQKKILEEPLRCHMSDWFNGILGSKTPCGACACACVAGWYWILMDPVNNREENFSLADVYTHINSQRDYTLYRVVNDDVFQYQPTDDGFKYGTKEYVEAVSAKIDKLIEEYGPKAA